jgi:hypothetical protein
MTLSVQETLNKYADDIYIGLYKVLNSSAGSLHNQCFNPPVSKMIKEYFADNGLWKRMADEGAYDFASGIEKDYIQKIPGDRRLLQDSTVWFLALCSLYYFSRRKEDSMMSDLMFLSGYSLYLKYYTSLSNKHMPKYCDKDKAMIALASLSDKSLFSSKNNAVLTRGKTVLNEYGLNARIKAGLSASTITLGMAYLYDAIKDVYYPQVKNLSDYRSIGRIIIAIRDRLSQSFKAYARQYYKVINAGVTEEDESEVTNYNEVDKALNMASQGMAYIPDKHYDIVHRMADVPVEFLKKLFPVIFSKANSDNTFDCLNIIMREKHDEFNNTNDLSQWLLEVRKVIAIRSRYDFRMRLVDILNSDPEIKGIYDAASVGYKHKMIQAVGLMMGTTLFDTLKQYMLGSIQTFYVV